jgi:hypothetical protein
MVRTRMKRAAAMITTAMIPHNEEVFTVILNFSEILP